MRLHLVSSIPDAGESHKEVNQHHAADVKRWTRGLADLRLMRMPGQLWLMLVLALSALVADAVASEPDSSPGGQMVIESDSACPAAEAIRVALLALRPPSDWPETKVHVRSTPDSIVVDLGWDTQFRRRLAAIPDCEKQATTVALILATWMDDLPAQTTTGPLLRPLASVHRPIFAAQPSLSELAIGALATAVGGFAPGLVLDLRNRPRTGVWGWQTGLALPAARPISFGGATTRWTRLCAGAAASATYDRGRFSLAGIAGATLAYTLAWGTGYTASWTDQSLTYGLVAGLRGGWGMGPLGMWAEVRGSRWLYGQTVQIDSDNGSAPVVAHLPKWDAQLMLGLSYGMVPSLSACLARPLPMATPSATSGADRPLKYSPSGSCLIRAMGRAAAAPSRSGVMTA